jgi:hypothetical protein
MERPEDPGPPGGLRPKWRRAARCVASGRLLKKQGRRTPYRLLDAMGLTPAKQGRIELRNSGLIEP